jgi:hypothetical protein
LITQGDDQVIDIVREDADGNAIDITGFTYWLTVKKQLADADADAVIGPLSVTPGNHTDPANGETQIVIPSDTTAGVAVGEYYYDIQEKDSSDRISTLVRDTLSVREGVTDAT